MMVISLRKHEVKDLTQLVKILSVSRERDCQYFN